MNTPLYRDYAPLAWFYDRYWGDQYPGLVLPVLDRLVLSGLPKSSRILDVCCGTGHLAKELSSRGFEVTGIDGCEEMLHFARERVPGATFQAADARKFQLPSRFHAALSTFESLNHMMTLNELDAVFQNIHAALTEGGVFFFDLLTETAYSTLWQKSSAIVEEDNACIIRGAFDAQTRVGRTEITLFRLRQIWERADVAILQKCHAPEEVRSLLARNRFDEIRVWDARRDLGIPGDLGVGRLFFLAVRKERIPARGKNCPYRVTRSLDCRGAVRAETAGSTLFLPYTLNPR